MKKSPTWLLVVAGLLVLSAAGCLDREADTMSAGDVPLLAPSPDGGNQILRGDVGDFVWCDANDNGLQDDGPQSGVNGVDVTIECTRLLDGSLFTMTFTTANDPATGLPGWYNFNAVPAGSCVAYVDPATIPADKMLSSRPCGGPIQFRIGSGTQGNNNDTIDFCIVNRPDQPGAIGDYVWCDLDDDGVQDPGEPPIVGAVVTLSCSGGHSDSQVTDSAGKYLFTGVPTGEVCTVTVDPLSVPDKVPGSGCPTSLSVTLGDGETNLDQDFCFVDPPGGEDCCVNGRPAALTMTYTGGDCSGTSHSQSSGSVTCTDSGPLGGLVHVKVTDKDQLNHHKESVFFEGDVALGAAFEFSAANAGKAKIPGNTRIWVTDVNDNSVVLQFVKFHTSCSQPLLTGDQYGSLRLDSCR